MRSTVACTLLTVVLAMNPSAFAQSDGDAPTSNQGEEIKGFTYDANGLTFQVYSGGCTTKQDFHLVIRETHPMGLRLVREKQDICEAFVPYGTKITFAWEELGLHTGGKFFILNPIAVGDIFPKDH